MSGSRATRSKSTVANLEAETDTGGLAIGETNGVTVGGVDASLRGLRVDTSGDIDLTAGTGSITLNDAIADPMVLGGADDGDVELSGLDITATADRDAISTPAGSIDLTASDDVSFGTAGANFDNDVEAASGLQITAADDIVFDGRPMAFRTPSVRTQARA